MTATPSPGRAAAIALQETGDYDAALPLLLDIVRQAPDDYRSMRALAEIYTALHEWDAARIWHERALPGKELEALIGWLTYWCRFGDFERARHIYRTLLPRRSPRGWDGEDIEGKSLHLIAGDIYLGDALQFVRFVRIAKQLGAARVTVQVPERLCGVVGAMEGVDDVVTPEDPAPVADFEAQAFWLLFSLPRPFDEIIGSTPYLTSPSELRSVWRKRILPARGLNVGIVWHGSPWRIQDRHGKRSMFLEDLRPLTAVPDITLYSLQYGEGREELLGAAPAFPAVDLAPDLPNTCAAIEALDLVVTIDTSLAHLAGALGKRTFLMLPYDACFRWMIDRSDTPWYASMRLFRQSRPGLWSDVVSEIVRALQ